MSVDEEVVAPSAMLDAAFRLEVARRLIEVDIERDVEAKSAADLPPERPRKFGRRLLRSGLARGYRLIVPLVRPFLSRQRQYNSSIVLAEIARLRLDMQVLAASQGHNSNQAQARFNAAPRRDRRLQILPLVSVRWVLDGHPMPHLHAALEQADDRPGSRLSIAGNPSQLAAVTRELSDWFDRTTPTGNFQPLTLEINVTGVGHDASL
jgi:hypothetical protein